MKNPVRGFRAWPENQERLEFAKSLGINPGDVINESLKMSAKKIIEQKAKSLREQLSVPVP